MDFFLPLKGNLISLFLSLEHKTPNRARERREEQKQTLSDLSLCLLRKSAPRAQVLLLRVLFFSLSVVLSLWKMKKERGGKKHLLMNCEKAVFYERGINFETTSSFFYLLSSQSFGSFLPHAALFLGCFLFAFFQNEKSIIDNTLFWKLSLLIRLGRIIHTNFSLLYSSFCKDARVTQRELKVV